LKTWSTFWLVLPKIFPSGECGLDYQIQFLASRRIPCSDRLWVYQEINPNLAGTLIFFGSPRNPICLMPHGSLE
jgi:hypothetical protein